jgi:thioester reductase-like protein
MRAALHDHSRYGSKGLMIKYRPDDSAIRENLAPYIRERKVLVTGAPNYVAIRMIWRVLAMEPETSIAVIVRSDRIASVENFLAERDYDQERVELLPGDETNANFGLNNRDFQRLASTITDIYHCAGIYHIGIAKQQVEEVNIRSTRLALAAARKFRRLERFNYHSSAFVAGNREGIVLEEELEQGQEFRNTYERTRFTAELDVRRSQGELPISVFRPSLIVGDSQTGEIERLDGPYLFIQTIARNPDRLPVLLPSAGSFPFNVVPIDFVVNAMHALSLKPEATGKTFHLVDPAPVSEASAFRLLQRHILEGPVRASLGGHLRERILSLGIIEKITRERRAYLNELDSFTFFNAANTIKGLVDTGIACPFFPDYVERLVIRAHRFAHEW